MLYIMTVLLIAGGLSSCQKGRKTTLVVKDNDAFLSIEYTGTIVFNEDNSGILKISPDGYFKCKDNDNKLTAETNAQGKLVYEVNGSTASANLDNSAKILLQRAVKEIAKQQGRHRS